MLVIATAGVGSGAIWGITLSTETERKTRGGIPRLAVLSRHSILGIVLNAIIEIALIAAVVTVVAVAILRLGNAYPLNRTDSSVLAFSWLFGAALAKWFRYRYWKRRGEWTYQ